MEAAMETPQAQGHRRYRFMDFCEELQTTRARLVVRCSQAVLDWVGSAAGGAQHR